METIAGVVIAIISATGGITVQHFLRGWREARQGRKDEAQRIAADRDRTRRQRDEERHRKLEWRDAAYATRQVSMDLGVPASKLPTLPALEAREPPEGHWHSDTD